VLSIRAGMKNFDDNLLEFTTSEKLAIIIMTEKIAKANHQIAPVISPSQ